MDGDPRQSAEQDAAAVVEAFLDGHLLSDGIKATVEDYYEDGTYIDALQVIIDARR